MPSYLLDHASHDWVQRLAFQPYPPRPGGVWVSDTNFRRSLLPITPLVAAVLYLSAVRLASHAQEHAKDKGKPWPDKIRSSKRLSQLVLFHNAILATFPAWAHSNAAAHIVPYFASAVRQGGVSGFSNAFCTVPSNDPAGLGRFVWWFYMSKYYEVVDSLILIAKGKKVSNLQAYHHAGAIAAMWSGCRYSASGIWIFLLFNSGIHTMMYTYFTLSTLRMPGASALKQAMTTAQIVQLFVGLAVGVFYFLLRYSPTAFNGAAPSIGDVLLFQTSLSKQGINYTTHTEPPPTKQYSFTWDALSASSPSSSYPALDAHLAQSEGLLHCLASTGHLFATVLNVAYMIPLIVLFVRFYIRSYHTNVGAVSRPRPS